MIYNQPKELSWKKSQKGCCMVAPDGQSYTDGHTWAEIATDNLSNDLFRAVFYNGFLIREYTLQEIRNRLHGGKF